MSRWPRPTGVPGEHRSRRRVCGAPELALGPRGVLRWMARCAPLVGVLAALSLLAACGGELVEGKVGVEPTKSGQSTVVVRVSGTEGVRYFASYGLLQDRLERRTETLEAGPTSYEVPVEERGPTYDVVYVNFMKLVPEGRLRVEVVRDGEVVASEATGEYEGVISLNYALPNGPDGSAGEGA